jgi:hypothetical protein
LNQHIPNDLREKLNRLIESWRQAGLPSRSELLGQAEAFHAWRTQQPTRMLWMQPPKMVIASLDDGMG